MIRALRNNRATRAFTLIEMSCVIATLFLAATLVMPDLVAMKRSRSLENLKAAIHRLPIEAANEARSRSLPTRIRINGNTLVLEYVPASDDPIVLKRVSLSGLLRIDGVRSGSEAVDTGSWTWQVYPDGSAQTGAIIFTDANATKSLVMERDGRSRWVSGEPPDAAEDEWNAGEIVVRQ